MNTEIASGPVRAQGGAHGAQAERAPLRVGELPAAPVFGHLLALRKDRIGFQHRAAAAGDVVPMRLGLFRAKMISSPELAYEVLVAQNDAFVKSQGLSLFARPLLGNGLLTSERDFHKKQRRMIAPVFVQKRIASYADAMAERALASAMRMRAGARVDVAPEVMRATLEIVGKTLFDADVGFEASEVGAALTEAMEQMIRALTSLVPIPPQVPSPGNRRARRAIGRLDRVVYGMIDERRRTGERGEGGEEKSDLLNLLLAARDEDGSRMDVTQLRDEAMTIFLAGHETTANAVAWALYCLSRNPQVRDTLEREVDAALGKRVPRYEDLKSLPFAIQVLKESMRLFPPAYIVGRRATRPVDLLGVRVDRNDIVLVNVAGMHRRADLFADPGRFDPDRFTAEREKALPRYAYLPFGAGPRVCIGNHFALMEGQILLATYAQHVRLDLEDPRDVGVEPLVTLRPKGALRARVTPR